MATDFNTSSRVNLGDLKRATISYAFRQVITTLISLTVNIVLTRLLLPKEFGVIAIVMMIITLGTIISDGGLGVYLIQRKEDVADRDVSQIVNVQLVFSAIFIFVLAFTCIGLKLAKNSNIVPWVLFISSLSIPFSVVRGMAMIRLERQVQMKTIALLDVIEQFVYALFAIGLAWSGLGAWSIVIAMLFKSLAGCLLAVNFAPWRYEWSFPKLTSEFKSGIGFALNYQGAQLINIARTAVNPVFINGALGLTSGGYVERAQYVNGFPVGIISIIQNKVFFPYASRINEDVAKLKRFMEDSIYINSALDKVFYLPLLLFANQIVHVLFTTAWLKMVPLLQWLIAGTMVFGSLAGPLYPVINALGASRVLVRFNFVTMLFSWILIVPLCYKYGIVGVGIASIVLWLGVFWLKKELVDLVGDFRFFVAVIKPTLCALVVVGGVQVLELMQFRCSANLLSISLWSLLTTAVYGVCLFLVDMTRLRIVLAKIYSA